MATKKGRAVTAAERPTYDALNQMMLEGRIFCWSVPTKNEWVIWRTEADFGNLAERQAGTDGGYRCDLAGATAFVGGVTTPKARTSVTDLRKLLHRLADAAQAGPVDPTLLDLARAA